jgi:hypothetical protein
MAIITATAADTREMGLVTWSTAAADAALNENIMNEEFESSDLARRVVRAGVVGSTAVGDCAVQIRYGGEVIATLYNTTAGANIAPKGDDMIPISSKKVLRAGKMLEVKVIDAPATNAIVITLDIKDFLPRRRRY